MSELEIERPIEPILKADPPARRPILELTFLALPTVLQMLAYTLEQFIDTKMLSHVGDAQATAAGAAGGVVFAFISFGFGVLVVTNALVSHHFGAKRDAECGSQLWQAIWFAIGFALLLIPAMWAAPWIFGTLIGHDALLVVHEVAFFNVMMAFVGVKLIAVAFGEFMIAINRPTVVFFAAAAGLPVNVVVNWLLIYGNAGFPKLGVAGAAWGTNLAVVTELTIVASVAFGPAIRRRFNTLAFAFDGARFRELMRIGIPSGVQVAGDVLAWILFSNIVIGLYGTRALAANNYMIQYLKVSFMPCFGLGAAVTALVARYVGAGRPELGERRAHLGFVVAAGYVTLCGLMFVIFRHQAIGYFTTDPAVIRMGGQLMIIAACFQLFDAMLIIYTGALRGVKDTLVPAVVQITLCWTLMVGGGSAVAKWHRDWGVAGPWSMGVLYCGSMGVFTLLRFRRHRLKRDAAEGMA